jgi:hypothetical protein
MVVLLSSFLILNTRQKLLCFVDHNGEYVPEVMSAGDVADMCFDSGKTIYVGNGTTGIFWKYDKQSDTIIAKISVRPEQDQSFVRIKRRIFSTATKQRSQFPTMLAWAATIHKVQGMEFRVMEVDFGLEGGNDKSNFYPGLAYMALSRAETVVVKGKLTWKESGQKKPTVVCGQQGV